jgi:hypothetical protein
MRRFGALACLVMTAFALPPVLAGRPPRSDDQQAKPATATGRYLILDTRQYKTMQKEIDEAAGAGFRVISGNAGYNILALERDPDGKKHQYLVTGSVHQMVKDGKIGGYRALPFTFAGGKYSLGAVLEKLSAGEPQPEYKVVWTARTSTLIKEMNEWAGKGFTLVALSSSGGNYALMERASGSPASGPADRYVLLATTLTSTLEKELADAVASGHRLAAVAEAGDELMVAMEKRAPGETAPAYRLITTTKTGTFEREILATVREGYHLLPASLCALEKTTILGTSYEVAAIMEKSPSPPSVQYKFLATKRVSTLQQELAEAAAAGWSINRLFLTYGEQMILLEKAGQ